VKINILQKSKYRTKKLTCVKYENVKKCVKKQIKKYRREGSTNLKIKQYTELSIGHFSLEFVNILL